MIYAKNYYFIILPEETSSGLITEQQRISRRQTTKHEMMRQRDEGTTYDYDIHVRRQNQRARATIATCFTLMRSKII